MLYNCHMRGRTLIVMFEGCHWVVRGPSTKTAKPYSNKSGAVAAAKLQARSMQPCQVIVLDRNGRLQRDHFYGLPKLQQPPYKSALGTSRIEQAVLSVSGITGLKPA